MRVLGVDPGGKGALALLDGDDLLIQDMPTFTFLKGRTKVTQLNCLALIEILAAMQPDVCYFEETAGREGESAKASYNFGRIAGACEFGVRASMAQFHFVIPMVWKKKLGIPGKEHGGADKARAMACSLWPKYAAHFARKMDDGRADAALIAWYGRGRDFSAAHNAEDIFA